MHRNKERMERTEMKYCTTLHVSSKWNYGGLKFMFGEAFCVLFIHNEHFFISDQFYLVTVVSYGDGKVSFFSVLLAFSFGVNNFVQEELSVFTIFSLQKMEALEKIHELPWSHLNTANIRWHHSTTAPQ